ncbi:MAG: M28 family peptidase [Paludibacteraceae bacterium]|nr:M28 family peptidase [Paludibacteraceae bacterium]
MKRILYLVLGTVVFLTACTKKQAVVSRPSFSSDSAYAYIEKQMAFGPRVPNSAAHMQCAVWLIEQLRACGAEVELQKGEMPDYRGNSQQIYNIIGHFYTPETAARPRILLGAHYDTRPWCDEEEDYADRFYNVPGANDGASGVGVLLEIARQTGLKMADSTFTTPVDIIFFDCEDSGTPSHYTGPEREDTWCLGSQLWATNYAKKISSLDERVGGVSYSFGIVLDMVGAPDASFPREMYSTNYAANYQQQIWRTAQKLGYGSIFTDQQSYPITDDHYYINYIAGIPCVDIIHYDIRNATGFPHWWHTRNDNLDNISKSTLQAVGEVVMAQIK